MATAGGIAAVDQNLYSRQLGVLGQETMGKLILMDVLLIGLRGLGVEIAKNLILAGPRSVTLFDPTPTTMEDTGYNYYLTPASIGAPRASACVEALSELNPHVLVRVLPEAAVTDDVLRRFAVVVATRTPRTQAVAWDTVCRAATPPVAFIAADVFGLAGFAFSDFGPAHGVRDANGEAPRSAVVVGINAVAAAASGAAAGDAAPSSRLIVHTHDGKRHNFDEGDYVVFREIESAPGGPSHPLNDGRPRKVGGCKAHSFELVLEAGDTAGDIESAGEGLVEQVKVPSVQVFESLATRELAPVPTDDAMGMLIAPDLGKFGRSEQLHVAFAAVEAWRSSHNGALPPVRDASAALECVALARAFVERASSSGLPGALAIASDDVDAGVVARVAALSQAELPALCAFFGGVVAQEVIKATGKYSPLRQWLYLDAFEVLPVGADPAAAPDAPGVLPSSEFAPAPAGSPLSRYDGVTSIIGRTLQAKIMAQRVFVVGAGALGCEFLKNYALMGVACSGGRMTITDMDRIEVSNLNRQFLFRAWNVGQPKSVTAAAAARAMNADLQVEALETPVGEDTEATFNDAFWEGLDIVTNALDNVKARQYVDGRCVWYGRPLLESGTLGTKANTQVIMPGATESYADAQDPPEESIPMCTLRNFPHAIEHCIEWARDVFEGAFNGTVQDASAFVTNPAGWLRTVSEEANVSARRSKLEGVVKCLAAAEGASFATCVGIAKSHFNSHFVLAIKQLLHNFPPDYVDSSTGVKFWTGVKRAPVAAVLDMTDPLHHSFLSHSAALVASNFGCPLPQGWDTPEVLHPLVAAHAVPEFVPKNVRIKAGENDATVEGADDDRDAADALAKQLATMAETLGAAGLARFRLAAAEFEKDDDANHHIDFIAAAANLRARNYKINEATRHAVKMTAGKIIPAMATTTCAVTGLVCLEFYKLVAGKPVGETRNSFCNLAVNVFSMSEPGEPKRVKSVAYDPVAMGPVRAYPENFSRWDKFAIREGDLTCAGLATWLKEKHGLELSMITAGRLILYYPLLYKAHAETRGPKPVREVYETVSGAPLPPGRKYLSLELSLADDTGDVIVPPVQLFFA